MAYPGIAPWNFSDTIHKFGHNADIDTGTEDVISVGGNQSFFTAAQAALDIDIASSDGADDNDTPAGGGTGARTITIEGIDGDGLPQSETIALNGAGDVHPTLAYLFIHRAYVATSGSGGVNAGNITIDVGGANTMAYIGASDGQTLMATYVIPSIYAEPRMICWYATVSGAVNGNVTFDVQKFETDGAWRVQERVNLSEGTTYNANLEKNPILYSPLDRIRIRATSSANNMAVSAGFDLQLM